MSRHLENQILARLDRSTMDVLERDLTIVKLNQGSIISETEAIIQTVYFPHSGVISCVVELIDGGAIETGMIGRDGQYGGGAALDHKVSLNLTNIQISGTASVIDADRFRQLADAYPSLRQLVLCYEQFFLAQVQQTSACNAVHDIPARTCKWLLKMHKLVGSELPLTQEFLAQMMGVRRTSVTEVAGKLQNDGMITYSRGRIHILDIEQIRKRACECDETVNSHYDRVFADYPIKLT